MDKKKNTQITTKKTTPKIWVARTDIHLINELIFPFVLKKHTYSLGIRLILFLFCTRGLIPYQLPLLCHYRTPFIHVHQQPGDQEKKEAILPQPGVTYNFEVSLQKEVGEKDSCQIKKILLEDFILPSLEKVPV